MIKNFMTPLQSYNVEETVNPNARSAENKHFRGYISLNKMFIKFVATQ